MSNVNPAGSFCRLITPPCLPRSLAEHIMRLQDGFTVKSSSGAVFEDVDLSEKEWMDYDEKLGESIGIYDLEWKLQAVKL